ncbi:MAG TPA: alcohol dehydrogenase catalytic domain-containing protein [Gammaproteobacteria bacterium]|nr:alcohol dehydrogenase catalytic domain-containing protein [Gammaproteobacteria bacterium]
MKALWLENGTLRLATRSMPEVEAGEALIKVLKAGICGTDAALVAGLYDFVGTPGHEFVGRVVSAPEALMGQRVVGEINVACGKCGICMSGWRKHCFRRTALGIRGRNGCFAEFLTLPLENLHRVPPQVGDDAAVFTEPLAAALDVLDHIDLKTIERVLVVGDGKLAQLVCRVLALEDLSVDVVGRHRRKLDRLEGVSRIFGGKRAPAGRRYDVAVECSGNSTGLATALNALKPRGTLVVKSTFHAVPTMDATRLVVDELRLVGSRCGPFTRALELLAAGRVSTEPLIDARYALDQGLEAFERSDQAGVLKVLLDIGA